MKLINPTDLTLRQTEIQMIEYEFSNDFDVHIYFGNVLDGPNGPNHFFLKYGLVLDHFSVHGEADIFEKHLKNL